MYRVSLVLCICTVGLFAAELHAQSTVSPFDVTFVATSEAHGESLRQAMDVLTHVLTERGGKPSEAQDALLYMIGLSTPDAVGQVAISITIMHKLPEAMVQKGKEDEAFYMRASLEERAEYPAEGKWVREHVSESFMRQFTSVVAHYVEIVDEANLEAGIESILDQFDAR